MEAPYDKSSKESIYHYAMDLRGSTLREKTGAKEIDDIRRNKRALTRHCARTTVHPPQEAVRECESGRLEPGKLFFVEKTFSAGGLRATYEYNVYHWPESKSWEADVISPHGWCDVAKDELGQLIRECGIGVSAYNCDL